MFKIPDTFFQVHYVASRIPGVENPSDFQAGANCQLFAYEILKHFGNTIPDFRSSDLWDDVIHTSKVKANDFQPLDLMLYHHEPKAYGAHVGLYIGEGKVIHLSKSLGVPEIREHVTFASIEKYAYFIGTKRLNDLSTFTKTVDGTALT